MGFLQRDPRLVGGRLCLDFANSADWRGTDVVLEGFESFPDVLAWGRHVDLIDARSVRAIASDADAEHALSALRKLRAACHAAFAASAQGRRVGSEAVGVINRWLQEPSLPLVPRADAGRFRYRCEAPLRWLAVPVALSAAELLTSADLLRVKLCPGQDCGWVFLDENRNGRRRWCSMETCGNRAKARAHYDRQRRTGEKVRKLSSVRGP